MTYKRNSIKNEDTFNFFEWKWKKVPSWGDKTKDIYQNWYLKKYGYTVSSFATFLNEKKNILDAGCGLGRDIAYFRMLSKDNLIVGLDQSESAINHVKSLNLENVELYNFDITNNLNKLGYMFDFISCDQVLHHTPDPIETLKNLASVMNDNATLHFFVCNKKNEIRDFVDDTIMDYARYMSPEQLWKFSEVVTEFGKALKGLNIENIKFKDKAYPTLQNFIHNQVFRCWYNDDIDFDLSVSSNYDWFSNNPRYSKNDVLYFLSQVDQLSETRVYEDDACIAVVAKKLS